MRVHFSTCTAQQPENNIVRVTIQALAAVLGGTQSLHTNSMDEALALPSTSAARTALRTQQILACESGVANAVDPAGGPYAVEAMTKNRKTGDAARFFWALPKALCGERGEKHEIVEEASIFPLRSHPFSQCSSL